MRVFLTGATGFIGSQVARVLLQNGCEVYALMRPESEMWRVSDIFPGLQIVQGSVLHPETWESALKKIKPELAFHLAWYAVPGEYLTSLENLPFLQASLQLATKLAEAGCRKMLAAGSCFEYDTRLGYLSETTPTRPETLYAACKLGLSLVLEQFAKLSGMEATWLRFFYLYGPFEDRRRLVPMAILSLLDGKTMKTTSGRQMKDFLHVEDVAEAVWAVAKSPLTGAVNIGSGEPVSVDAVVEKIGRELGRLDRVEFGALTPRPWDPPFVCADNRKLSENTAWKPKYTLEEGLRQTIAWWKTNPAHP